MALVPLPVVTVTWTVPDELAGEMATIRNSEATEKLGARVAPNLTLLAPPRFMPVMATLVDPEVGPLVGQTPVTIGAGFQGEGTKKVNWSDALAALVPPAVVTVISTVPAEAVGDLAVIWVAESTV